MISQGVGLRSSLVAALVGLSALVACASNGEASREVRTDNRVGSDLGAVEGRSEPERVVQRMAPAPAPGPSGSASSLSSRQPGSSAGTAPASFEDTPARGDVAPTGRQGGASSSGGSSSAEGISQKHLEAELNRLEAEIGH